MHRLGKPFDCVVDGARHRDALDRVVQELQELLPQPARGKPANQIKHGKHDDHGKGRLEPWVFDDLEGSAARVGPAGQKVNNR